MGATDPVPTDVRRAADRTRTRSDGIDSRHSFSSGRHYDPADTHLGLLIASDTHRVRPGAGFDAHPHRDLEIVTWVLDGSLVHRDSTGHSGVVRPGLAQRMSAGSGILHSEFNGASDGGDVRLVQMWVVPDTGGTAPGYEQRDVGTDLGTGDPVVIASGMAKHRGDRAVSLGQEHAALTAVRLRAGGTAAVPGAPLVHLSVVRGCVELEGTGALGTEDAARIAAGDGQRITAGPDGAEVLIWEMHATLGPR